MQTGLQALQQTIENGKSRGGDFSGGSLSYFTWKDKDRKVVRFLTDDVITADFHEFIMCADGTTKSFLVDPAKGDFVAKYASPTPGVGWRQDFRTKQPMERKPASKTVAVAVLRDRVPRAGGGFDVVDEVTDTEFRGEKFQARKFGLIIQSHGNFWKSLIGYFGLYGTLTDRDYLIERKGSDKDTEYTIVPLDPVDELRDVNVLHKFYGYGQAWDGANPDRFLFCPQTLAEWADKFSSEERAKHFLVGDGPALNAPVSEAPSFAKMDSADEAQSAPVASSGNTDFSSLRAKLLPHASATAAQ
jgi:hypothetical protein